jgi:hypothetical protein
METSDWVIQEIGLARGKNLSLILLMERGVRKPGGLQGDVEYISFDREAPEKAFGKIVEMLNALSPKVSSSVAKPADGKGVAPPQQKEEFAGKAGHWSNPKPDWDLRKYKIALHFNALFDDEQAIDSISQAYLSTSHAQEADNKASWAAYVEYTRMLAGKGGSLARLEKLAEEHPHSSGTLEQLANGYRHYQDYDKSARTLENAATQSTELICS